MKTFYYIKYSLNNKSSENKSTFCVSYLIELPLDLSFSVKKKTLYVFFSIEKDNSIKVN